MLNGKRIWITGASSGIGAATARVLAAAGAELVLSARRVERLQALADQLNDEGYSTPLIRPLDITVRAAVEQLGMELESLGGVWGLVNNAGVMPISPMLKGRVDEWEQTLDTNLKAPLYCINAVLGGMAKRGTGHILTSSPA